MCLALGFCVVFQNSHKHGRFAVTYSPVDSWQAVLPPPVAWCPSPFDPAEARQQSRAPPWLQAACAFALPAALLR